MNEEELKKQLAIINEKIFKVRLLNRGNDSLELETLMKEREKVLEEYRVLKTKLMLEGIENEEYKRR